VTYDPNPDSNTVRKTIYVEDTADLVTTATSDNPSPKPGDTVTYTVNVRNNGPSTADDPTLSFTPPSGLTNVEYTTDGGKTWTPWPRTLTMNDIPNGDTTTLKIRGTIDPNASGSMTPEFTAKSPTDDPMLANNTEKVVTKVVPVSDLVTTVTIDNPTPKSGDTVTYNINIHNNGPSAADDPTVSFSPPAELTNVQYSNDGGKTWTPWPGTLRLNNLPNGDTSNLLIRGNIPPNATGVITATVTSRSSNMDPVPENNTVTTSTPIAGTAQLSVSKTADNVSPRSGDTVTYTISIWNSGPATAVEPILYDSVPPQITNAVYSPDGGLNWETWPGSIKLKDIPNGVTVSMLIRGMVASNVAGSIQNTAKVTSPTDDPNNTRNTAVSRITVERMYTVEFCDCKCRMWHLTVPYGSTVPEPAVPKACGYYFIGWYTKERELWDFSKPITENLRLYARWIPYRIQKSTTRFCSNCNKRHTCKFSRNKTQG
jgi:uncharacterized repeat protein (TIGR01451 family)